MSQLSDTLGASPFRRYVRSLLRLAAQIPRLEVSALADSANHVGLPIYVIHHAGRRPIYRALIAAGLHGDEQSGPLSILMFLDLLRTQPDLVADWALDLVPIVNPTGFDTNQRANRLGQDPNRGYILEENSGETVAPETRLLKAFLRDRFFDTALSLHEDMDEACFYLYSFERANTNVAKEVVEFMACRFEIARDDYVDGSPRRGGIIADYHDGSLEDWLSFRGVPSAFCAEMPGQASLDSRTRASLELVIFFLRRFALARAVQPKLG